MYAIVDIRGKQFKVEKDRWLLVPKINDIDKDGTLELDKVLIYRDDKETLVGQPYLDTIKIKAKVLDPIVKQKKIIVFKFKKRKDYRRKQGHRQKLTKLMIEDILKS